MSVDFKKRPHSAACETRPKVYRCDSRSAAITAMGFEDSDSKDCDPIDSDS